jgi:hypothetical protein
MSRQLEHVILPGVAKVLRVIEPPITRKRQHECIGSSGTLCAGAAVHIIIPLSQSIRAVACANKGKLTEQSRRFGRSPSGQSGPSHKSRAERATWLVLAVRQGTYDAQRLFQKPPCLQI